MKVQPPQQDIINAYGERVSLILPVADYQAIINELDRLAAIPETGLIMAKSWTPNTSIVSAM
jgi:hypothetical protein